MAITQVRAQINGVWYALTYDAAARCYVAEIPAGDTSADQPGGYYNVTVEAANDTGAAVSVDGTDLASLQLMVKDLTAPTVTLVSPPQGYVTTQTPEIVVDLLDDSSGINLPTLVVSIDGAAESGVTTTAITGGYRATITPTLADGLHTVEISVTDNDGNTGTLTLLYTIDTTPPVLEIWDHRLVIDTETVLLRGFAQDSAGVFVAASVGDWTDGTPPASDGSWRLSVPLSVGANEITITATDGAGLTTTATATVIRMITDRTQRDLEQLLTALDRLNRGVGSEDDFYAVNSPHRGAYSATDLNRVGAAVALLTESLNSQGFQISTSPKTDWTNPDLQNEPSMELYLQDIQTIFGVRLVQAAYIPLPPSVESLTLAGANSIEWALVSVDAVTPVVRKSYIYSGEAMAGEF